MGRLVRDRERESVRVRVSESESESECERVRDSRVQCDVGTETRGGCELLVFYCSPV